MLIQLSARSCPTTRPELVARLNDLLAPHLAEVHPSPRIQPAPAAPSRRSAPDRTGRASRNCATNSTSTCCRSSSTKAANSSTNSAQLSTTGAMRLPDAPTPPASPASCTPSKGSARMVSAMTLGQSLHDLETRLDRARSQSRPAPGSSTNSNPPRPDRQSLDTLETPGRGRARHPQPWSETTIQPDEAAPAQPGEIAAQASRTQLRIESRPNRPVRE